MRSHFMVKVVVPLLSLYVFACGAGSPAEGIECILSSHCDRAPGGECVRASTGKQWCAYADSSCASGLRHDELDVGDGLAGLCVVDESADGGMDASVADGQVDAYVYPPEPPDAGAVPTFDVAFLYQIPAPATYTFSGFLRIHNTGTLAIDMSTLEIVSATSVGANSVVAEIATPPLTGRLEPGQAGGWLSELATGHVDQVLTTPVTDDVNYLRIHYDNYDWTAGVPLDIRLRLEGHEFVLSIWGNPESPRATPVAERFSVP